MVGAPGSPLAPLRGPTVDVCYIDSRRSRIYNFGTSQGARRRRFLALMVGAPRSPSAPPRGPVVDVFLALMVSAPRSIALAPPRGPVVDVS
jgi:hypothetical protein